MHKKYQDVITSEMAANNIAVVIPCYKVKKHIMGVLKGIKAPVDSIYCVDDGCPDGSGKFIEKNNKDKRVRVLYNNKNIGTGGAVKTGYRAAMEDKMDIIVKVDGDGQMDPALIPNFIKPILLGHCDFTKGNRFYNLEDVRQMPLLRLIGNAGLSFLIKLSSGYWHIFDPTNGYTAVHTTALRAVPLDKLPDGYGLESGLLFRLNTIGAVVQDVPMTALYADEISNMKIGRVFLLYMGMHLKNFIKRIFYNYFLRDFNLASLELLFGVPLITFGTIYGAWKWIGAAEIGVIVTSGDVMLAALPIILGVQMVLAFFAFDTQTNHTRPYFIRNLKMK